MNCPICNAENLSSVSEKCYHCKADLSQLAMVNELEGKYVDAVKERLSAEGDLQMLKQAHDAEVRRVKNRANWIIGASLLLSLTTFLCYKQKVNKMQQSLSSSAPKQSNVLVTQKSEVAAAKITASQGKPILHTVEAGENFENIGVMYFKDAAMGSRIAADNNKKPTQILSPGDTIYIYY